MKNGKVVTDYLDECAYINTLRPINQDTWLQRITEGPHDSLWQACVAAGWTITEMDDAFERRFGRRPKRDS